MSKCDIEINITIATWLLLVVLNILWVLLGVTGNITASGSFALVFTTTLSYIVLCLAISNVTHICDCFSKFWGGRKS